MNAQVQTGTLGCLHRLPARLGGTHTHRPNRCKHGQHLQVQAVAESETQAPASTNGSTSKVSPLRDLFDSVLEQVDLETACVQAGVPAGTPVVDTLVSLFGHL